MPDVTIHEGCLLVGDERVPLYAGEVHYWRLKPARWGAVLERVREIGLNVVATYVPWQYHELSPGRFDFTGDTEPSRNLVGFLRLLHERGFHVFIRPGPFIYAEWVNAGVPDRVVALPRLSEEYRREASVWMRAVTETLRPFFATRGGPICLFQPDNEMDLFSHWFEGPCGLDGTQAGFFQQFLREAYAGSPPKSDRKGGGETGVLHQQRVARARPPTCAGGSDGGESVASRHESAEPQQGLAELNRAWGTAYASFEEVQAFAEAMDERDPHALARRRDYWRFQHWAVREALRWHVEEYRRLGVDLPMVANYYPGGDVQNWREVAKVVDLVGIDWYPTNEFGGRAEEQRRFLDTCRYQRALSRIPFIAELESGVWHGYHEQVGALTPNHYRLMAFSALLAGIRGFNWYMLVGRDNWYYSPINERGEWRPELASVFQTLHRVVEQCDPPRLRKLTDVAVVLEPLHFATDRILEGNPVLTALYEADADFEVFDPEIGKIEKPVMFYAAADWLSRASQQRLNEYMERGGTLVVFRNGPRRDENFAPHNGLGVAPPDRVLSRLGKQVELLLAPPPAPPDQNRDRKGAAPPPLHDQSSPDGHRDEGAVPLRVQKAADLPPLPVGEGAVWCWDRPPGEPIWGTQIAGRQQAVENADKWMTNYIGQRWCCGYREPRGRGALVVIGLPPSASIIHGALRGLGRPLYARAQVPGVKTGLFERDGAFYLFATNLNATELQCGVELDALDARSGLRVTDLWSEAEEKVREGILAPASAKSVRAGAAQLFIALPARCGGAWRIQALS